MNRQWYWKNRRDIDVQSVVSVELEVRRRTVFLVIRVYIPKVILSMSLPLIEEERLKCSRNRINWFSLFLTTSFDRQEEWKRRTLQEMIAFPPNASHVLNNLSLSLSPSSSSPCDSRRDLLVSSLDVTILWPSKVSFAFWSRLSFLTSPSSSCRFLSDLCWNKKKKRQSHSCLLLWFFCNFRLGWNIDH